MSLLDKKTLCIVTGASQGIGQTISTELAAKFLSSSTIVLIARSVKGLETTKSLIVKSRPELSVLVEPHDLGQPDYNSYKNLMKKLSNSSYDSYMLVHNAGTEGNGELTNKMTDFHEWQSYMSLNLFHVTMLTSAFLEAFTGESDKVIINITSLAAVQPFSGLGYYCIGKSAREMYFRTLALENPTLRVLSYSPGPVNTEMITRVIDKLQVDETRQSFVSMKEKSVLLSPHQTISKLVSILEANSFESGSRIDYFDA